MRFTCLLLLAFITCMGAVEEPFTITIEMVTEAQRQESLKGPWVREVLMGERKPIHLHLWYGAPAVPVPGVEGKFQVNDFKRFLETEFNNTRNGLLLLGPPDSAVASGPSWTAVWGHHLREADGSATILTVELSDDGRRIKWKYARADAVPMPRPAPNL